MTSSEVRTSSFKGSALILHDVRFLEPIPREKLESLKAAAVAAAHDSVNHPRHYRAHPSGVECITVTEHMNFCLGNAVKYIWRAGQKGDAIEDLKKARWYLDREIARLEKEPARGLTMEDLRRMGR